MGVTEKGCRLCKYYNGESCENETPCHNYSNFESKNSKIKPTYYGTRIDVIDFCQKNNLDFMQGNVIKYVTRYKDKNGKEDLLKAIEYIERIIKEMENSKNIEEFY